MVGFSDMKRLQIMIGDFASNLRHMQMHFLYIKKKLKFIFNTEDGYCISCDFPR